MIAVQGAIKFHGGGHINHSIFWNNLSPNGGGLPSGDLAVAIQRDFGSFDNFKTQLSAKTVAIQGSGWGWLVSGLTCVCVGLVGEWIDVCVCVCVCHTVVSFACLLRAMRRAANSW